jgi:glycosyltransferase involved in cell wall biosynthesis
MRILHAIHDFLPRHRAGSEIYAFELARELSRQADVFVLAAEYDPATPHGTIRWRSYEGLTVVEIVNNWQFRSFDETYASERINSQLAHVLDATAPDVLHVHNLLNLSFDLPRLARERGIRTVATLHDYTLVCPSGGQRVHVPESHICESIDTDRCARCFNQSVFKRQMSAARLLEGRRGRFLSTAGRAIYRLAPSLTASAIQSLGPSTIDPADVRRRLAAARQVFDGFDLVVSPSSAVADEFRRLGMAADRLQVSDYGFAETSTAFTARKTRAGPLRIGFVGTLVWHKGVHVLVDAARGLQGSFEVHIHGDVGVFPEYTAVLERAAAGISVRFAGGFDRDRVHDVYRDIDVVVVPSLWPENSPLVIHEAFMRQLPVVAARVGGVPELVQHDVNGLLYDAFSVSALRAALQRLIDDRTVVDRLGARAPAVKSIAQDAREWRARYEHVCARPAEVCAS